MGDVLVTKSGLRKLAAVLGQGILSGIAFRFYNIVEGSTLEPSKGRAHTCTEVHVSTALLFVHLSQH